MNTKMSRAYYFAPVKIVRDLVHEYVNLTKFDLDIIDTVQFQRLKDIRQLTCQHVYPDARHTRFEHSLGVLELTRKAIKHINLNGIIGKSATNKSKLIISEHLQFNAALAALLHDVGHCPFSHMGEVEFDSEEVRERLCDAIDEYLDIDKCCELYKKIDKKNAKGIGAPHEQLSCISILVNYHATLSILSENALNEEDGCDIETDFELIIRSILGIEYDISSSILFEQNKEKNVIIRLINSSIFDMDKLDYIMRDSFYTGIGTPIVDTQRLFRNMYFNDRLSFVFTSKAVPSLQNMIDSRDGLYMYVYNHHAVVFSDFLNTFIVRRLSRNAEDFISVVHPNISDEEHTAELETFQISALGLVPKPYFFSTGAILQAQRSDSDWLSLLNVIDSHHDDSLEFIQEMVRSNIYTIRRKIDQTKVEADVQRLSQKIHKALELVHKLKTRQFLKPWWKTVFEFTNFMNHYFRDDIIRKQVEKFICNGGDFSLEAAEFRSQIAKHVIYITKKICLVPNTSLIKPLEEGEFFVIQRSTRFFAPDTIEKLEICLKSSEITGPPTDVNYQTQDFYVKTLTKIIPQKDYTSIYAKEGFYIFSAPISKTNDEQSRNRHYKLVEQIFVFVATEFIHKGEQTFNESFQKPFNSNLSNRQDFENNKKQAELESMEDMATRFIKQYI